MWYDVGFKMSQRVCGIKKASRRLPRGYIRYKGSYRGAVWRRLCLARRRNGGLGHIASLKSPLKTHGTANDVNWVSNSVRDATVNGLC